MEDEKMKLELESGDLCGLAVKDVVCTNCIEGFCPARMPSMFECEEFILCGAKKLSQPVLEAFQGRTGVVLHIERPC